MAPEHALVDAVLGQVTIVLTTLAAHVVNASHPGEPAPDRAVLPPEALPEVVP